MNNTFRNITRKLYSQSNTLRLFRSYAKRVKEGCECPEPKDDRIVEEKKCIPCSFVNWKPRPRRCIENDIKEDMKEKKPKVCYAGMVMKKPVPTCKDSEIDPFKKKPCLPRDDLPEKVKHSSTTPSKKIFPASDWDHNCK